MNVSGGWVAGLSRATSGHLRCRPAAQCKATCDAWLHCRAVQCRWSGQLSARCGERPCWGRRWRDATAQWLMPRRRSQTGARPTLRRSCGPRRASSCGCRCSCGPCAMAAARPRRTWCAPRGPGGQGGFGGASGTAGVQPCTIRKHRARPPQDSAAGAAGTGALVRRRAGRRRAGSGVSGRRVAARSRRARRRRSPGRAQVGVVTDIRGRRSTAEAMHLCDKALAATSEAIVITDPNIPDNPIVYCNAGFEKLTGAPCALCGGGLCAQGVVCRAGVWGCAGAPARPQALQNPGALVRLAWRCRAEFVFSPFQYLVEKKTVRNVRE